jgi:hypothetical protein
LAAALFAASTLTGVGSFFATSSAAFASPMQNSFSPASFKKKTCPFKSLLNIFN